MGRTFQQGWSAKSRQEVGDVSQGPTQDTEPGRPRVCGIISMYEPTGAMGKF